MLLPEDLRNAIDLELSEISHKKLAKLTSELSDRYRNDTSPSGKSFIKSQEDVDAYVAFRMPATFAAVYSALKQAKESLPGWNPQSFLDVGAGPGTAMWAAGSVYPELDDIALLEREEGMIALGKRLAKHSVSQSIQKARWIKADITDELKVPSQDLVIASYVLGELNEQHTSDFIKKLWSMTKGALIIIEPGTPAGFTRVRQAREKLIDGGGQVAAPCPHNISCPIEGGDWCHFSQRVSRSRLHRQVKSGDLSYEDEKFSFIAVSRVAGNPVPGRILRHPLIRKGHIELEICSSEGMRWSVIIRKNKELYRSARGLSWGSAFSQNK